MARIKEWEKEIGRLTFKETKKLKSCLGHLLENWEFFESEFGPAGLNVINLMLSNHIIELKNSDNFEFVKDQSIRLYEAKNLKVGDEVYHLNPGGKIKWIVSDSPKIWKTKVDRVQVPIKYGMHVYGYLKESNLDQFTLDPVPWSAQDCFQVLMRDK